MSEHNEMEKPDSERLQMFDRFLTIQESEIDLKKKEVNLRTSDLDNQKEIALASLEAQLKDRECERNFFLKQFKHKIIGGFVVFFAVAVFLITLIMLKESDLAKTLIEDAVKIILGVVAGYGYKTIKSSKETEKE